MPEWRFFMETWRKFLLKVSNNPKDFYGKIYQQRKAYELDKNERLEYKEQADLKG